MNNQGMLRFLQALIERLLLTTQYNRDEVLALVNQVQEELWRIGSGYESDPVEGLEGIHALMREAVELFQLSCQQILAFVATDDEAYLVGALTQAEEADDILITVRDLVEEHKTHLEAMADSY